MDAFFWQADGKKSRESRQGGEQQVVAIDKKVERFKDMYEKCSLNGKWPTGATCDNVDCVKASHGPVINLCHSSDISGRTHLGEVERHHLDGNYGESSPNHLTFRESNMAGWKIPQLNVGFIRKITDN